MQNPGITAGEILFGDSIESALQISPGSIVDSASFRVSCFGVQDMQLRRPLLTTRVKLHTIRYHIEKYLTAENAELAEII